MAFRITLSTASGRSGLTCRGRGGGSLTCMNTTARGVSASYGTCPVTISYSSTAQRVDVAARVQGVSPATVWGHIGRRADDRPAGSQIRRLSHQLGDAEIVRKVSLSLSIRTLLGLMSRCSTPWLWA